MATVTQDPQHWRQVLDELQNSGGPTSADHWEALIEGWFRLAVTPGTPFDDSVRLLRKCLRLDGSNPKFAYHLGRLFFAHGRLEEAAHWLEIACRLNPTSHRVWAHACLLHWELNERFRDPKRYEPDSLRKRGNTISDTVQRGKEPDKALLIDFTPQESRAEKERRQRAGIKDKSLAEASEDEDGVDPTDDGKRNGQWRHVRRFLNAGVLRWSGIKDLAVEYGLQGEARQSIVKALVPLLLEVAGDARRRRGGLAAFAVLAVQWVVSGYPTATIRRLLEGLELTADEWTLPSVRLANCVCDIFDADGSAGLSCLAQAASVGDLPPLLTALIHRRKILSQPLKFGGLGAYRNARRILFEARQGSDEERSAKGQSAIEAANRLEKLVAQLAAEPPRTLEDWIPKEVSDPAVAAAGNVPKEPPGQMLQRLETGADALDDAKRRLLEHLRQEILASAKSQDPQKRRQAAADLQVVAEIVSLFERAEKVGTQQLAGLIESLTGAGQSDAPENFPARSETLKAKLSNLSSLGSARRNIKKARAGIAAARSDGDDALAGPSGPMAAAKSDVVAALQKLQTSDAEEEPLAAEAPGAVLEKLEKSVARLDAAKRDTLEFLRGVIAPAAASEEPQQCGQAAADLAVVHAVIQLLARADQDGTRRLAELIELLEDAGTAEAPKDFPARSEELKARLSGLSNVGPAKRNIKKFRSKLEAAESQFEMHRVPESQELAGYRTEIIEALSEVSGVPIDEEEPDRLAIQDARPEGAPERRQKDLEPIERLAQAIGAADHAVDAMFDEAEQPFRAHARWVLSTPPVRDLYTSVQERRAELSFRMGRRAKARQVWNRLLRNDPHHIASCKNVAVNDTWSADAAAALASWKLYARRLYASATTSGDVHRMAQERMALHRSLGQGSAVRALAEKMEGQWEDNLDADESLAFIASGYRVKDFIDHKLLEFLNQQIGYRSPSLVLGVARDESEDVRKQAAEAISGFARQACEALPRQSRQVFIQLVEKRLEESQAAFAESKKDHRGGGPVGDVHFAEEREEHIRLLSDMAELKFKLYRMALSNLAFVRRMASVDFLEQFRRLDELPLTLSDQFSKPIAAPLGMQPAQLQELMKMLAQQLCADLLTFLFEQAEDAEDQQRQQDQYERLTEQWVLRPAFKDLLPLVDNPGNFYPQKVKQYIEEMELKGVQPELLEVLRDFHTRYPRVAGIARDLADLLLKANETEEALRVLARAARNGCHEDGRKLCRHFALQVKAKIANEKGDYADAIKCMTALVNDDNQNPRLITNLIVFYSNHAGKSGVDPGFERLSQTVSEWRQRARSYMESWESSEREAKCLIDEETLEAVEIELARGILSGHMGCAVANYNRSVEFAQEKSIPDAMQRLEKAREFATYVIDHADEKEDHELLGRAKELMAEIKKILSQIS
ncbi:tetratricopeptide repeat protein [Planctomycetota bacterium]